jgi:CHAT domain-containing protein
MAGSPAAADDLNAIVRQLAQMADETARRDLLRSSLDACDVEALLTHLKAEAERTATVDPHTSLRLAESLIAGAELARRPGHRALGVMAKGDALRYLGRYPESLEHFEAAARSFQDEGDEVGWARTRIGWLVTLNLLGRAEEAFPSVERAREILVAHKQWLRVGALDGNTAWVNVALGRFDQAMHIFDRAQHMFETLGDSMDVPVAYIKANKAITLRFLGDFRTALALHEEARQTWVRRGETRAVHQQDHNIACVYAGQGHYTRALRLLSDVLAARERAGLEANAGQAALDMIECYLSLNRNAEAFDLAEETVARFTRCGTPTEAAKARFLGSLALARLGDTDAALAALAEAALTFAGAGLDTYVGIAKLQRAALHLAAGRSSEALATAEQAHATFAARRLVARQAQAQIVQARAALALGRLDAAASLAHSALATSREREVSWLVHESHHVLAGVARAHGDLPTALTECGRAIGSIEQTQSQLANQLRSNFLEDKLQVYGDAIDCALGLGDVGAAFAYLERAKSRALVDYLRANLEVRIRARDAVDRDLADELARLREEHNWFYNRLYGYGLADRPGEVHPEREGEVLAAAIRDRERRIGRIIERLALRRDEAPDASHAAGAVPAVPSDGQAIELPAVQPDTVLLEYFIRDENGVVFVASAEGLEVVRLAVRPRDVRRLLYQWQLNLDATARAIGQRQPLDGLGRNALGILGALYRALIHPVRGHLLGRTRLVVVPYGLTHSVPFHALYDGRRYLIEDLEVTACPSSTLLQLSAARARSTSGGPARGRGALVVACSDGGRLPHVLDEARSVAALLNGEQLLEARATREAVVRAAPRHRVLHLAAHGEARLDNPTFAHLKLADGQLSAVDVFNLGLDGALVTLSACETGRGVTVGGDELIGLARGFLYAGAATLVQSLWRVEDASTAALMGRFYQELRAGRPKGAALRAAQRALLADHGEHPYSWAAFQLIGDAGPLEAGTAGTL